MMSSNLAKAFLLLISALMVSLARGTALAAQSLYVLQTGTPVGIKNFIRPEDGCNWSGIGGQVFDGDGYPITGLIVKVSGSLEGSEILRFVYTGNTPKFGPGGFGIELTDHPAASTGTVFFQLLDINGVPRSAQFSIDTYGTCEQNLLLINLYEETFEFQYYFPSILNDL